MRIGRLLALALAAVLAGCGQDSGGGKVHVSGTATFNGQPIPAGQVTFTPAAGNSGPQGFADIRDGKYDTSSGGQGTVGGPHDVRITGFDAAVAPDRPTVKALFNEYTVKIDLPKEGPKATQDLEVPASAAQGLIHSTEPPP
jgi:hypothetical protein